MSRDESPRTLTTHERAVLEQDNAEPAEGVVATDALGVDAPDAELDEEGNTRTSPEAPSPGHGGQPASRWPAASAASVTPMPRSDHSAASLTEKPARCHSSASRYPPVASANLPLRGSRAARKPARLDRVAAPDVRGGNVSATTQVTEADATIQTDDGPMPVHVAVPAGTAKGAVVVVQEAFGVTAHIEDVTRRFARAGWHAVAPALFHREGSPVLGYDERDRAMPIMGTLTAGGLTSDLLATFAGLDASGFGAERTAVVGFCMGGTVAFYAATLRPLAAAVTFYGGGVTTGRFGFPPLVDLASSLATPWLGLYGDEDQSIPVADVELLREQAAKAPVETEIVRYAGAGHGFHCDDRPAAFAPDAAADAWRRTLGWLVGHTGAQSPVG